MRILTLKKLKEYSKKHKDVKFALMDWFEKTKNSNWNNFSDIKKVFNSVDYVGNNRFVF